MTYNIAAGHGDLGGIAEVIRQRAPDIVGLQEVDVHWSGRSEWEDQAQRLAEMLGMEIFYAPIYRVPNPKEGQPVREFGLAFLSRHPIRAKINHQITRLSTQPDESQPELKPGFPEIVVDIDGRPLRLFNTHLDYRPDPRVRVAQVKEMLEIIGEINGPTILLGDLNARPDAEEIRGLLARFRDAWNENERGPGHTFPAKNPDRRIDYLLVSEEIQVERVEVIATEASDHRPIVGDFLLPK